MVAYSCGPDLHGHRRKMLWRLPVAAGGGRRVGDEPTEEDAVASAGGRSLWIVRAAVLFPLLLSDTGGCCPVLPEHGVLSLASDGGISLVKGDISLDPNADSSRDKEETLMVLMNMPSFDPRKSEKVVVSKNMHKKIEAEEPDASYYESFMCCSMQQVSIK